jgi:uncharacterized membrane protein
MEGLDRDRLTAFTDGVVAVIITVMVLEMKPPHGTRLSDLAALYPVFLSYVLSFVYIAIYWNNHHHFFQLVTTVNGAILWANLHLLFWLSLVPFCTAWVGQNPAAAPTALYGVSLLMAALAWYVMQTTIIRQQGPDSPLKRALGSDLKGKLTPLLYIAGIAAAFWNSRTAGWSRPSLTHDRIRRNRLIAELGSAAARRRTGEPGLAGDGEIRQRERLPERRPRPIRHHDRHLARPPRRQPRQPLL